MPPEYHLQRFTDAQVHSYPAALSEIRAGKKRSHWMWYIFPQIAGLGLSSTSRLYAIQDLDEAQAYMQHPILGSRLREISRELLLQPSADAAAIFGTPDHLKLRSSMTLFSELPDPDPVFQQVLDRYFDGAKDPRTLKILGR